MRDTLAAAYAEAGRYAEAVAEQKRAIKVLKADGNEDQIPDFQSRLVLYESSRPYRE